MSLKEVLRDYGGTILVAVTLALCIRFFLLEAYRIPSSAMRPTLEPGDTIFVEKWPFGLYFPGFDGPLLAGRKPRRGEVVVFALPDDSRRSYIKRVVGLEGDTVEVKDGHFIVNGAITEVPGSQRAGCSEEKIPDGGVYPICYGKPPIENFPAQKVPENSVFLLGDYRAQTPKERGSDKPIQSWGVEPLSSLRGKALWIWLSVEPPGSGNPTSFPNLRFERMFRRIE